MMKRERGNRRPRRKVCSFCVDKVQEIDYKDAAKLRKFITERARSCLAGFPVPVQNISVS